MKIKTFGFLLLALFVVSSLKAVWANEVVDIEELTELDGALEADVDEFGKVDENEVTHSSKHICKERNVHYVGERCMKFKCNHLCNNDGYKKGKCHKSKSDEVRKCYCYKHCEETDVPPINPVTSPSNAPVNPPTNIPSSIAPANFPDDTPPSSAPAIFPDDTSPSSAPVNYPAYVPPSSAPDDTPTYIAPAQGPTSYKYFEDEEADIIFN